MPETSAALIDQLVYIDNFINSGTGDTPNLDMDGQLSLDLAAFADDLFIFPDEEKSNRPDDNRDDNNNNDKRDHDLANTDTFNHHWLHHDDLSSGHDNHSTRKPDGSRALASINESTKLAKLNRTNHYATHSPPLERRELFDESNPAIKGDIPDLSNLPKFPVPPGAKSSLQQAGLSQNQIDLLSALIAQHQSSLGNEIPGSSSSLHHSNSDSHPQLPFANAPTLASSSRVHVDSLIQTQLDPAALLERRNSNGIAQSVDSPGSLYSSGYSSGANSMLSTPQISSRGSISLGSSGLNPTDMDKRKRNTAASARFRIKKKLKEKEMETKIDQLDEMIKNFELKINELEMENRLLKNLIIEKGNRNSDQELKLLKERIRLQK